MICRPRSSGVIACVILLMTTVVTNVLGQSLSKEPLARILATGSVEQRGDAIAHVMATPIELRGGDVLPALLEELDRQDSRPLSHEEGELQLNILRIVAQYPNDDRVMPYVYRFLPRGTPLMEIAASHGERSVGPLLAIARSTSRSNEDVAAALISLKLMLEKGARYPLTASSRARIKEVASERLNGRQASSVLMEAVDLALATKDAALRARVQELVADSRKVEAMGIEDSTSLRLVRSRAAQALEKHKVDP